MTRHSYHERDLVLTQKNGEGILEVRNLTYLFSL